MPTEARQAGVDTLRFMGWAPRPLIDGYAQIQPGFAVCEATRAARPTNGWTPSDGAPMRIRRIARFTICALAMFGPHVEVLLDCQGGRSSLPWYTKLEDGRIPK